MCSLFKHASKKPGEPCSFISCKVLTDKTIKTWPRIKQTRARRKKHHGSLTAQFFYNETAEGNNYVDVAS